MYSDDVDEEPEESTEDEPSVENVVNRYIRQGYEDIRHGYEVLFGS